MSRKLHMPSPREPAPSLQLLYNDPRDGGIGGAACVPGAHGYCFIQPSQQPHEGGSPQLGSVGRQGPQQAEPGSGRSGSQLLPQLASDLPCLLQACWSVHLRVASVLSLPLSSLPWPALIVYTLHNSDLSFRVAFWGALPPHPLKKAQALQAPACGSFPSYL